MNNKEGKFESKLLDITVSDYRRFLLITKRNKQ